MFKKISFFIIGALILLTPALCFAFDYGVGSTQQATNGFLPTTVAKATDPATLAGNILKAVLSLIGIIFFILIFYAGLVWMTSQGKTERVDKAKGTLEAAVVGLVLIAGAYAITSFVLTGLGG